MIFAAKILKELHSVATRTQQIRTVHPFFVRNQTFVKQNPTCSTTVPMKEVSPSRKKWEGETENIERLLLYVFFLREHAHCLLIRNLDLSVLLALVRQS